MTKETRLLTNDIKSLKLGLVVQIYKLSHTELRTKVSCESQSRYPSHRFTGKSEQNMTTDHSHWSPCEKGERLQSPRVVHGLMHSGKGGAVHSG